MGGCSMTTPSEYREIAEECREAMRGTTSPEVRAELLRLSLRWDDLADDIERRQHLHVGDLLTRRPPAHHPSSFR
jgi:hypothetical protein